MYSYNPELNTQLLNHLFDLARNHCKSTPTFLTLRDYSQSLLGEVPRHNSWQMVTFQTKTEQATEMVIHALDQGMTPEWILGDSVYGESPDLRVNLQNRKQAYVLGVTGKHYVWIDGEQKRVS